MFAPLLFLFRTTPQRRNFVICDRSIIFAVVINELYNKIKSQRICFQE